MPFWFSPAASALLLVLLLLQGLFLLAATKERSAFVFSLTTGWFFLYLHLLADLAMLRQVRELMPAIASQLTMAVGLILLFHACRSLRPRHTSPWPAVAAFTAFCLWVVPSQLFLDAPLLLTLPTFCFFAALQLLTAFALFQAGNDGRINTMVPSWAMGLWGVCTIAAPFLAPPPTMISVLTDALLMLCTGLGILPILFSLWVRRNHSFGERCRALFTHGQDAMFVYHLNNRGVPDRLLEINDAACRLLHYNRQELLRCSLRRISAPGIIESHRPLLASLLAGNSALFPWRLLDKNGRTIPVEVSAHIFTLDGEQTLMASARDLSEHQQVREELEQSHQRLLLVLDSLDSLVYVAEMDTYAILYANQAMLREFGETQGKRCWQIFHHDQHGPCPFCPGAALLLTPEGVPTELHAREAHNSSSGRWYHITSKAIHWQGGRLVRLEIATDITERVEAERGRERELAVRTAMAMVSEELLAEPLSLTAVANIILSQAQKLTGSKHGFIGRIDPKDNSLAVPVCTAMMEPPTNGQVRFPAAADGRHHGLWGQVLNTGHPFFTNTPNTHQAAQGLPDGHVPVQNFLAVPLRLGNTVAGQLALANSETGYSEWDLSAVERLGQILNLALQHHQVQQERELLITELRQSQKMEAIGTLAGGIAHDFNNILSAILGHAELTQLDLPQESRSAASIRQIIRGCKRAAELIQQIQAFSRTFGEGKRPVSMQFVLKESLKLLRATIPTTVEIREEIDTDCPSILADITALHQIVVNLCTNAYHAMMPKGGLLSVTLGATEVGLGNAHDYPTLTTGAYVKLSVQDTGCGMDARVLEQIFDPTFTTKRQSVGSGLGLATVRHLVTELGGAITVASEPGMGSTFEVLFPAIPADLDKEGADSAPTPLPRFNATVLLVDDELSITTLGRAILEKMGCTVKTFTSSLAALECFTASPDAFDLVITDQAMPELTGYDLAKQMLAIRPALPLILATGYSEIISAEQAHQAGIREYLLKPLSLGKLGQAIGRLLPPTGQ